MSSSPNLPPTLLTYAIPAMGVEITATLDRTTIVGSVTFVSPSLNYVNVQILGRAEVALWASDGWKWTTTASSFQFQAAEGQA